MKTRQQKEENVKSLTDKLSRAKSLAFADYQGLTMSQLSELRGKLKDSQAEFSVTKNTLMKLALDCANRPLPETDTTLKGPVATLFAYEDEVTPIKTLVKALKDFTKGQVKSGFLGNEYLDSYKVISLSQLPSKGELQGKVVWVLAAPIYGIVGVLNANLRNLVCVLDQVRQLAEQKGGE